MLHLDVFRQRLIEEHDQDIIFTSPSVTYEIETTDGKTMKIENPLDAPPEEKIKEWREPICEC